MKKDIFVKIIKEEDSSPPLIEKKNKSINDSFLYKGL
jgi:hypothetical protein